MTISANTSAPPTKTASDNCSVIAGIPSELKMASPGGRGVAWGADGFGIASGDAVITGLGTGSIRSVVKRAGVGLVLGPGTGLDRAEGDGTGARGVTVGRGAGVPVARGAGVTRGDGVARGVGRALGVGVGVGVPDFRSKSLAPGSVMTRGGAA